jgi:hypothetical protein
MAVRRDMLDVVLVSVNLQRIASLRSACTVIVVYLWRLEIPYVPQGSNGAALGIHKAMQSVWAPILHVE